MKMLSLPQNSEVHQLNYFVNSLVPPNSGLGLLITQHYRVALAAQDDYLGIGR
jgi:hypothetical protein